MLVLETFLTLTFGNSMDALLLLLRWMHIFGVVILVGGLCFSRFALLPALCRFRSRPDNTMMATASPRVLAKAHAEMSSLKSD